jgi:PIN domain nuclease of toxin-antitoxin system
MNLLPDAVLLDTCAVIWLARGLFPERALPLIVHAGLNGGLYVSPISAWEVGMIAKPRSGRRPALEFLPDPKTWFAQVMAGPGIRSARFTPDIAIEASFLPGNIHDDLGDRLIIATARNMRLPIVTRDEKIIAYATAGHVEVIAC